MSDEPTSDDLRRARAGDKDARAHLVVRQAKEERRRREPRMGARSKHGETISDGLAVATHQAFEKFDQLENPSLSGFKAWFRVIVDNVFCNLRRKQNTKGRGATTVPIGDSEHGVVDVADADQQSPSDTFSFRELQQHIDELPEREAQILRLRFGPEQMTLPEIGAKLGIDKRTVSRHLERARAKLRNKIAEA